jgi:release factor glutamine methyltransferase
VADVGTGSGAVGVAIVANEPKARVVATEVSGEALAFARANAERWGVDSRMVLRRTDLLEGEGRFDVIVANLPYVSEEEWLELAPEIRDHEPRGALVGGMQGTEANSRLLAAAANHLLAGGTLALEMGARHGETLARTAREFFPEASIRVRKDLAGLDRVLEVRT